MTERNTVKKPPKQQITERFNIIRDNNAFNKVFPITMLCMVIVIFSIITDGSFYTVNVMKGILNQGMIVGTLAIGVSTIYATGNLDISVGAAMALAAIMGAKIYHSTESVFSMLIVTIGLGLFLMLLNCVMSNIFKVKSMMVAIVMMQIYTALIIKILGASELKIPYSICKALEDGGFRYISLALYFLLVLVLFHFTKIGRAAKMLGGNEECARQTGISSRKYSFICSAIAGLGVGLAAVYTIIRTGTVSIETGNGMGMNVMLATVLGGMSIFGGAKSNSYAGFIGALTVVALNKGLLMAGVSNVVIQGIRGVIFLLLVYLNSPRPTTLPTRQQV